MAFGANSTLEHLSLLELTPRANVTNIRKTAAIFAEMTIASKCVDFCSLLVLSYTHKIFVTGCFFTNILNSFFRLLNLRPGINVLKNYFFFFATTAMRHIFKLAKCLRVRLRSTRIKYTQIARMEHLMNRFRLIRKH